MVGWILLGVFAALILLILFVPIRLCFRYGDQPELTVKIAFVPIPILPQTKKTEKKSTKPAPKKPKDPNKPGFIKNMKQQHGLAGLIAFLKEIIRLVSQLTGGVLKGLVLEHLDLFVSIGGADPAETAVTYGKACATIYPAVEALRVFLRHGRRRVEVQPDYFATKTVIRCDLVIRLRPILPIRHAIRAGFGFIRLLVQYKRKEALNMNTNNEKERALCPDNTQKT